MTWTSARYVSPGPEQEIVRGPQAVPTGRNLTAKLPGGAQIEYVEWDEAQWERAGGRPGSSTPS
ncbi:hypothetical protein AB0M05_47735 [Streptomyces violaceusniger]|uniref:hypothetical protein n=1 Tax=Streptomyces violaceusniger TaxID=68280 RepID=UPI0034144D52